MAEQTERRAAAGRSRRAAALAAAGSAWSGVRTTARLGWRGSLAGVRHGSAGTLAGIRHGVAGALAGVRAGQRVGRRLTPVAAAVRADLRVRRLAIGTAIMAVSLAGVVVGVLLGAHTQADVGPFQAELAVTPSLGGNTKVTIPPLGALSLDSHDGPAHLAIRLGALDQARSQALIANPNGFAIASQDVARDLALGVIKLGLRTLGMAVLSSLLLAALVFRNARRVAWAGGLSLAVTAGSLGVAAGTFRANAIEEPRYEGLLVNAPAVVGDARQIADRYEEYSAQLQRLVGNVSRLYGTISTLPVYEPDVNTMRVLHISDMHLNLAAWSVVQTVVEQFDIDLVIDTGDMVDWGSPAETTYASAISRLGVPYVFIRGNHDSSTIAAAVGRQRGAVVLDNSVRTIAGLTVAGIGDPLFTPDKESAPPGSSTTEYGLDRLASAGESLAGTIRQYGRPVDVALVHDPAMAAPLAGTTPLVLAGHLHKREMSTLPRPAGAPATEPTTTLMVQGSTGGAGLRGLEQKEPLPLDMSVLYFGDATPPQATAPQGTASPGTASPAGQKALRAYDDISVGGTGLTEVALERHVFKPPATGTTDGQNSGSPSPSPNPSPSTSPR